MVVVEVEGLIVVCFVFECGGKVILLDFHHACFVILVILKYFCFV